MDIEGTPVGSRTSEAKKGGQGAKTDPERCQEGVQKKGAMFSDAWRRRRKETPFDYPEDSARDQACAAHLSWPPGTVGIEGCAQGIRISAESRRARRSVCGVDRGT